MQKIHIMFVLFFIYLFIYLFFRLIQQNTSILLSLKREHLIKKTLLNSEETLI